MGFAKIAATVWAALAGAVSGYTLCWALHVAGCT